MKFYCVKCRKEVEANKEKEELSKKGLRVAKSHCPVCSTKLARILGK